MLVMADSDEENEPGDLERSFDDGPLDIFVTGNLIYHFGSRNETIPLGFIGEDGIPYRLVLGGSRMPIATYHPC